MALNVLCAGAAQGLVNALQPGWLAATGVAVQGRFGAVGAMKEALLAGEPCDVLVVTASMVDQLVAGGLLDATGRAALGRVQTGVAVVAGRPRPDVSTADALRATLLAADAVYFPDPQRATAGIHFASVMQRLGIHDALAARFRTWPNGATAMREMAAAREPAAIGCTQVTEIRYTEGVDLVAALPPGFELATPYAAAVAARSAQPALAARFVALLGGADSLALRRAGGFDT